MAQAGLGLVIDLGASWVLGRAPPLLPSEHVFPVELSVSLALWGALCTHSSWLATASRGGSEQALTGPMHFPVHLCPSSFSMAGKVPLGSGAGQAQLPSVQSPCLHQFSHRLKTWACRLLPLSCSEHQESVSVAHTSRQVPGHLGQFQEGRMRTGSLQLLCKGREHPWILVSPGAGARLPQIEGALCSGTSGEALRGTTPSPRLTAGCVSSLC